jgi:DNA repair protein RadA/Sms
MAKSSAPKPAKDPFRCAECGWTSTKWAGRCGECQAWGTVEEISAPKKLSLIATAVTNAALPIGDVAIESARARTSGVPELDRVLGGGLVPGAAILLAGEPGVGKSTLLLTVAAESARLGLTTLYISGEESTSQVRLRAERLGALDKELWLASETELGSVISHIDQVQPALLIIDSIQTIGSAAVDSAPGGVTQVREVAAALIRLCKDRAITLVLVGHVTKDGSIAGPRLLEHVVDVVLQFEGERHSRLRLIRAIKNRYGASDEVGCFDLHDGGIEGLPDPTGLFTTRHIDPVPGTCVTVTLEGRRPLLADILASLIEANNEVLISLNSVFDLATKNKKQGIANFVADRIDTHEKHGWWLRASAKKIG